jgi:hypothetical protein
MLIYSLEVKPAITKHENAVPESNIAIHSKRHGIHELCCVRDQRKQGNAKELFINARTIEDDVDDINQELCKITLVSL